MSDTVIKVENLGKLYKLGEIGTGTLSHDLNRWWAMVRGKGDPHAKVGQVNDRTISIESEYVWALKDINFEVKQGEVLGIIGRNGAGKSTLLKILSKVTSPTVGNIKINGRIASLLEVGTGFHPELTGRENIYLNGAILGMTRAEVKMKFDEIVDFAGVEKYIDTPVKRYSSGMYVRLAFAVAAFLEQEILIVDEVLAVGDLEFQRKCLGRMQDVSNNDGRTVLFVSHNMGAIKSLCPKSILFNNGRIDLIGISEDVISKYTKINSSNKSSIYLPADKSFLKEIFIKSATLLVNNRRFDIYANGDNISIEISIRAQRTLAFSIEILIRDVNFMPILFSPVGLLHGKKYYSKIDQDSHYIIDFKLPFLAAGLYYIDLMVVDSGIKIFECVESALSFTIESNFVEKTGWNFQQSRGQGAILLDSISTTEL